MSRLADYFVVVSYGDTLEAIDPSEFHTSLFEANQGATSAAAAGGGAASSSAATNAACEMLVAPSCHGVVEAVALVGGAGGTKEVEPSVSRFDSRSSGTGQDDDTTSNGRTQLSPILASPAVHTSNANDTPNLLQYSPTQQTRSSPDTKPLQHDISSLNESPSEPAIESTGNESSSLSSVSPIFYSAEPIAEPTAVSSPATVRPDASAISSPEQDTSVQSSGTPLQLDASSSPHNIVRESPHSSSTTNTSALSSSSSSNQSTPSIAASIPKLDISSPQPIKLPQHLKPSPTIATDSQQFSSSTHAAPPPSTPRSLLSFTERIYRARIVDRYPAKDHRSVPLPPGVSMFCIPDDITLHIVPDLPLFYFFAATGANGVRLYGSCLKFFEPLPKHLSEQVWAEEKQVHENRKAMQEATAANPTASGYRSSLDGYKTPRSAKSPLSSRTPLSARTPRSATFTRAKSLSQSSHRPPLPPLTRSPQQPKQPSFLTINSNPISPTSPASPTDVTSEQLYQYCLLPHSQRPAIYASKCICILSTHPFLRQFRQFLTEFYRTSLTPSPIPIERLIINFMSEIPLPPLGEIKVLYTLNNQHITFARAPSNNPFGFHHFPVRLLFELCDLSQILLLYESMLSEKRILLLSKKMSLLTIVCETLLSLFYPFHWSHVYIPLLPKSLIDFLHAPMPFLIGMNTSYLNRESLYGDILDDLVIVDLDEGMLDFGTQTKLPVSLPYKERKKLLKKLRLLNLYKSVRSELDVKVYDDMDLAFENAPMPCEDINVGGSPNPIDQQKAAAHSNKIDLVHAMLIEELQKNRNESPRSTVKVRSGSVGDSESLASQFFTSGLISSTSRQAKLNRKRQSGWMTMQPLTSPSALAYGQRQTRIESPTSHSSSSTAAASPSHMPSVTSNFDTSTDSSSIDYLICSAFFRVWVSIFKDYRSYLIFPTQSNPFPDPCFDLAGFLKSQDATYDFELFLNHFTSTQSFRRFVEERTFPSSTTKEQNKRCLFFEESILAKRNRNRFGKKFSTPFLQDRSTDLNKTFVVPQPDLSNLPLTNDASSSSSSSSQQKLYVYPLFPKLNPAYFVQPRQATPMLVQKHNSSHHHHQHHHPSTSSVGQPSLTTVALAWQKKLGATLFGRFDTAKKQAAIQQATSEQVIATLWFLLYTAISGEIHSASNLDVAFQVLVNLRHNGMITEEEIFPHFMFACGSCNVPERAIDVLREMNNSGYTPDSNTYAALLQVFTMSGDSKGAEALVNLKLDTSTATTAGASENSSGTTANNSTSPSSTSPITGNAVETSLRKELSQSKLQPSSQLQSQHPHSLVAMSSTSNLHGTAASLSSALSTAPPQHSTLTPPSSTPSSTNTTFYQHPFDPLDPKSPCHSPHPLKITQIKEGDRIRMFQLQFEMIFPELQIHTEESCPECNVLIEDHQIRAGWTQNMNDYTTCCPVCHERFVARFSVRPKALSRHHASHGSGSSLSIYTDVVNHETIESPQSADLLSPESLALYNTTKAIAAASLAQDAEKKQETMGDGPTTAAHAHITTPPLLLEYLPPRVLKKEVLHLLESHRARHFSTRKFRTTSPVLFWNLIWHFTNQCFPVDFLIRYEKVKETEASIHQRQQHERSRSKAQSSRRQSGKQSKKSSRRNSHSASQAAGGDSTSTPAKKPLDAYDYAIRASRRSGIGRSFGYGSGGMVSGSGAVGISLGSFMRSRAILPNHSSHGSVEDGHEDEDGSEEEEDDHEHDYAQSSTAGEEEEEDEQREPENMSSSTITSAVNPSTSSSA